MREREGTASVSTLIPSDSSLNSLGIDCHAFLPSMDNQSLFFFEELSMGTRALGSLFILGEEQSLRSLSIYPSCYPFKDKTSFDLSFRKLIETVQLVVYVQES